MTKKEGSLVLLFLSQAIKTEVEGLVDDVI